MLHDLGDADALAGVSHQDPLHQVLAVIGGADVGREAVLHIQYALHSTDMIRVAVKTACMHATQTMRSVATSDQVSASFLASPWSTSLDWLQMKWSRAFGLTTLKVTSLRSCANHAELALCRLSLRRDPP